MNHIIALVGMCGAGKSVVSEYLTQKGYQYIRFGDITEEEMKKRNLEINEQHERMIRESLRKDYGMGAYATLNLPKIKQSIEKGNVIVDGLYSWTEYKILKDTFGDMMTVLAVFTPRKTRYHRLHIRKIRPLTQEEAMSRDMSEIENLEKGGPISIADYTIVNDEDIYSLNKKIDQFLGYI